MNQRIAFLINPLKNTFAISAYFSWVIEVVKLKKKDWEIQLFANDWPTELSDFDQVWVMGGDGTFNYFVNKYPSRQSPLPSLAAHAKNPAY